MAGTVDWESGARKKAAGPHADGTSAAATESATAPQRGHGARVVVILCFVALLLAITFPVAHAITRVLTLGLIAVLVATTTQRAWRRRWARIPLALAFAGSATVMLLPDRPVPQAPLRSRFTDLLTAREGTFYLAGGESALALDGRGMVRRAWYQACFLEGLLRLHGGLLRESFHVWLMNPAPRDWVPVFEFELESLGVAAELDRVGGPLLLPGDFVIGADGLHLAVYLGRESWVESDPDAGRVVVSRGRERAWMQRPLEYVRWRRLAPTSRR